MIIGVGIGAVLVGSMVSSNCQNAIGVCFESRPQAVGTGLAAGALWGAAIGALVKSDRWRAVPLEHIRVTLAPARGRGAELSVTVQF